MGKEDTNSKKKPLSTARFSQKKGLKRLQELAKSMQDIYKYNAEKESTSSRNSSIDQPNITISEDDTKMLHCLDQIEEEQMDNDKEEMEASDEESLCSETKYCKDANLVSVNIDSVEGTEGCNKENMHNQSTEYSEDEENNDNYSVNASGIQEKLPIGNCIINFSYFWLELKRVFCNHARGIDCQFEYWKLINYRRRGLLTQFFFKCEMCHYKASIWSEPVDKSPDLNALIVAESVRTRIGYSQLNQLFASMDIAFMSYKTYRKYQENLTTVQKNVNNIKNGTILNQTKF